ncbi:MAG: hypothetical protein U9M95_01085 [Candidatus Altiarchaeota archaeon]|nr:hypothetical protein [Candidatus Altiarchaeota archaeon]
MLYSLLSTVTYKTIPFIILNKTWKAGLYPGIFRECGIPLGYDTYLRQSLSHIMHEVEKKDPTPHP